MKHRLFGTVYLTATALICHTPFWSNQAHAAVEILHPFSLQPDLGRTPVGRLLEFDDGYLYGVTTAGGQFNQGTIYRLKADGTGFQAIYHFNKTSPGSGAGPTAGLLDGKDGYLYGTTETGSEDAYYGLVYRIKPDGTAYQVLRAFSKSPGGLRHPVAPLTLCSDSRLYTVTRGGGHVNFGAVCSLDRNGDNFKIMHLFEGTRGDGADPIAGLVETHDHFLLGVTTSGGAYNEGTLYRLDKDGSNYKVLFNFSTINHGGVPYADLVRGEDGSYYGLTSTGGRTTAGSLFKVSPDGASVEILQYMPGAPYGAAQPKFPMTKIAKDRFVLVTPGGGSRSRGFIGLFRPGQADITPLHHFLGDRSDGGDPNGPLIKSADGSLLGVTARGGSQGYGTVYRLRVTEQ